MQEDKSGPWRVVGEHRAPWTTGTGPECSSCSHHLSGGFLTHKATAAVATGRIKGPYRYVRCICSKYQTQEESSKDGSNMITPIQMWVSAHGWMLVLPVLWSKSGLKNAPLAVSVALRKAPEEVPSCPILKGRTGRQGGHKKLLGGRHLPYLEGPKVPAHSRCSVNTHSLQRPAHHPVLGPANTSKIADAGTEQ